VQIVVESSPAPWPKLKAHQLMHLGLGDFRVIQFSQECECDHEDTFKIAVGEIPRGYNLGLGAPNSPVTKTHYVAHIQTSVVGN